MSQPEENLQIEPTDMGWVLAVALPGAVAESVKVAAADRELRIEAGRDITDGDASDGFSYHLILPADVDAGRVTASFDGGVLTVQMPRVEPKQTGPPAPDDTLDVGAVGEDELPPAPEDPDGSAAGDRLP